MENCKQLLFRAIKHYEEALKLNGDDVLFIADWGTNIFLGNFKEFSFL